jgi:hypothetical protein
VPNSLRCLRCNKTVPFVFTSDNLGVLEALQLERLQSAVGPVALALYRRTFASWPTPMSATNFARSAGEWLTISAIARIKTSGPLCG